MPTLQDALKVLYTTPTAAIYEAVQQRQSKIITDTQQKQLEIFQKDHPNIVVKLKTQGDSVSARDSRQNSSDSDHSGTTTESTDSTNITTLDAVNTVLESSEPNSNLPSFLSAIKKIDQDIREPLSPEDNQTNALTRTKDDWLTQKKPAIAKIALGLKGLSVATVRPNSPFGGSHSRSNDIYNKLNEISYLQALEHIEKSVPYNPSMSTQVSSSAKKTASPLTRTDFIKELDAITKLQKSEHMRIQKLQAKREEQKQKTRASNQNAQQQAKDKTVDHIHSVKKTISKQDLSSLKDDLLRMQEYQQKEVIEALPALQLKNSDGLGAILHSTRSFLNTALATLDQRNLGVKPPQSLIGVNKTDIKLLALAIKVDAICDIQENRFLAGIRSGGVKRSSEVAEKFHALVEQADTDTKKRAIFGKFSDFDRQISESKKLDTRQDIEKACQEAQQALEHLASEKPVDEGTRTITAPNYPVVLREITPEDSGSLSENDTIRLTNAENNITTLDKQLKEWQKASSDCSSRAESRKKELHNNKRLDSTENPSQSPNPKHSKS
jgi:hypothetical protein